MYYMESPAVQTASGCGCLARMRKKRRKPTRRFGHVAVSVDGYMVVWGGGMHGGLFLEERYIPSSDVWIYHIDTEKWYQVSTFGDPMPPGMLGSCAVAVGHQVYIIGGHTGAGATNDVWILDLQSHRWTKVKISSNLKKPSPRDKFSSWEYENKIYIFGGFGLPIQEYLHDNGEFFMDGSTWQPVRGWNNQMLTFDLVTQTWENPVCRGSAPTPRAAHATARLGESALYLFGGRHCNKRLNDLYVLDLNTNVWTMLLSECSDGPCARSWHTFTPISNSHIFLYGGYAQDATPLSDAWLLNVDTVTWQPLVVPGNKPRLWHTAVCSYDSDVLIFGGCCNDILHATEPTIHTNELLAFRCTPKSLVRLCLDFVYEHRGALACEWDSLPKPLAHVLHLRSDYTELAPRRRHNHGAGAGKNNIARVCCVS